MKIKGFFVSILIGISILSGSVLGMEVFIKVKKETDKDNPLSYGRGYSIRKGFHSYIITPKHVVNNATSIEFWEDKINYKAKYRQKFDFNEKDTLDDIAALSTPSEYSCSIPTVINCGNTKNYLEIGQYGTLRVAYQSDVIKRIPVVIIEKDNNYVSFIPQSPSYTLSEMMSGSTFYVEDTCFAGMLVAIHGDTGKAILSEKLIMVDFPEDRLFVVPLISNDEESVKSQYSQWISKFNQLIVSYYFKALNSKTTIINNKGVEFLQNNLRELSATVGIDNVAALEITANKRRVKGVVYCFNSKSNEFISYDEEVLGRDINSNADLILHDLASEIGGNPTPERIDYKKMLERLRTRFRFEINGGSSILFNCIQHSNYDPVIKYFKSYSVVSLDRPGGNITADGAFRIWPQKPYWLAFETEYHLFPSNKISSRYSYPLNYLEGFSNANDSISAIAERSTEREERLSFAVAGISFSTDYLPKTSRLNSSISISPKVVYATYKASQLISTTAEGQFFSCGVYSGNVTVVSQSVSNPVLHTIGGGIGVSNALSYQIKDHASLNLDLGYTFLMLGIMRGKSPVSTRIDIAKPKGRMVPLIVNGTGDYGFGTADYYGTGKFIDFCKFDDPYYTPDGSTVVPEPANKEISYFHLKIGISWSF